MADKLAYICAAAALLATLAYTGVLTPPHEISDCQDICEPTATKFILVLLESQRYLNDLYSSGAIKHTLNNKIAGDNNNTYTAQKVINAVLKSQAEESAGQQKGQLTAALQVFLFFNASALFASVSCLLIACSSAFRTEVEADKQECLFLLAVSAAAAYVAFLAAHFQAYFLGAITPVLIAPILIAITFPLVAFLGWTMLLTPICRWLLSSLSLACYKQPSIRDVR